MKIKSVEEALRIFEENVRKQAETLETGEYRKGNRCFTKYMRSIAYLYEHQALQRLTPLLSSENVGIRCVAAYALLPITEKVSRQVLKEIEMGNYGFISINAKYTLIQWDEGKIIFPYQEGFHW